VFGEENSARILFFNFEPRLHSYLKSFLVFLDYKVLDIPEVEYSKLNTDPRIDRKLSTTES
jgi:orotidine-5'-phosphate decarboxylase